MVRRFILLKTYKSEFRNYSEYIIYSMDYCESLKDPLKQDMKITNDEEQEKDLFHITVKNEMTGTKGELKRGWKEYSISEF